MIQFITRSEVFESCASAALEISDLQKAMFEGEAERFENETDKVAYNNMFDCKDLETRKVDRFYKVLSINHTDIDSFTNTLSDELSQLLKVLEVKRLIVIAGLKMNFFGANLKHDYPPVKKAFRKLETITQSKNYQEAFELKIEDLPVFIDIVFWLERCDASVPEYIFFFDANNCIAFNLCKDGNVHTIEFEKKCYLMLYLQAINGKLLKAGVKIILVQMEKLKAGLQALKN